MKVILLKDIRGVGQHGEVKDVADGYAINALFPKKLAEAATEEKLKQFEAQRQAREAEAKKLDEQMVKKIEMLRGKKIVIASRSTEKGGLFKGIVAKDIAKAILAEHSLEVPEADIQIPQPIKTVGEHKIQLVYKNTKADFEVVIVAA